MADATLDLATVWDQIRERLATSLSPQQNAMLNLTRPLGLVEDTAVLAAPNEFTQTVLESRMRRVLAEALSEQFGRDIRVAVQLEDAPAGPPPETPDDEPTRRPWSAAGAALDAQRAEEDRASRDRADDGRSAFGVRTDAVGSAPWDRDPAGESSPRADSEVRELRPAERAPVDRGAPEDWATTTWGAEPAARDWGGADDGRSADVLPFENSSSDGDQRGARSGSGRGRRPDAGPVGSSRWAPTPRRPARRAGDRVRRRRRPPRRAGRRRARRTRCARRRCGRGSPGPPGRAAPRPPTRDGGSAPPARGRRAVRPGRPPPGRRRGCPAPGAPTAPGPAPGASGTRARSA